MINAEIQNRASDCEKMETTGKKWRKKRSGNGINIGFINEISKKHILRNLVEMLKISNSVVSSQSSQS